MLRNVFMMDLRCSSDGNFQYNAINCKVSFFANGSFACCSEMRCVMRPLRFGSGKYPGSPWKKNEIGVSSAVLNSNKRDADIRLPAVSYFWICWNVTPQIFAKYNVGELINFINSSLENREKKQTNYIEPLAAMVKLNSNKNILAVSINTDGDNSHISYRLYNNDQSIALDSKIIKDRIKLQDIIDSIDTVLLQNKHIDVIGIAIPGVIVDGYLHSGIVADVVGQKIGDILQERYKKDIVIVNDVNAAAVGYYASQNEYQSLSMIYQPINRPAGAGIIINGQLIKGFGGLAGEVQLLPLQLSDDFLQLSNTPEGTLEIVVKQVLSIISIISPEEIVIYSDLIFDCHDVENEIRKSISRFHLNKFPHFVKIENLSEYILLGTMILSAQA